MGEVSVYYKKLRKVTQQTHTCPVHLDLEELYDCAGPACGAPVFVKLWSDDNDEADAGYLCKSHAPILRYMTFSGVE